MNEPVRFEVICELAIRRTRRLLRKRRGLVAKRLDALGHFKRFATDVDAVSASYSYFNALIGSTRDARSAGMKPAQSATSASATAESARTAGSAPVI